MNELSRLRHAIHLQAYMSTSQSEPFPLDGSEWARLVSMRVNTKQRVVATTNTDNFWQKVHSEETPVRRERKSLQQGIQHWFAGHHKDESTRKSNSGQLAELRNFWHETGDFRDNLTPVEYASTPDYSRQEKSNASNVTDGIRFLTVQPDCI